MYNGKHHRHRKRSSRRKAAVLLSSLALLITLAVGITAAFLIASDGPITNLFNPSAVSCQVNEQSFDGMAKTNVTIANTGDTEAYIRAAIVVSWKDEQGGNVYGAAPVEGKDYTVDLNVADWIKGNDGYYYYKKPVAPKGESGSVTAVLIKSCTVKQDNAPVGYGLNVEILGSAIQSVPVSAVNEKWPAVTVSTAHGELSATQGGAGE